MYIVYPKMNGYIAQSIEVLDARRKYGYLWVMSFGWTFSVPFNHLGASRLKTTKGYTVFLSVHAFRREMYRLINKMG